MKFAIWIAVALALASVAGILIQEFFPVRSQADAQALSERLPGPVFRAFMALHLHDVFRSFWFRILLGALAASLVVCSSKRFRSALKQATSLHPFREPQALLGLQSAATVHHTTPELFDAVVARLRRRFYRGTVERGEAQLVAALHQGGLARTGPVLLHLGILALVLGGLATSLVGRRVYVEAGAGQTVPIEGSRYALHVDDFQIDKNDAGQIKQYRSQIVLLEGETEVARREVLVNSPLRHAGYNIYQSSYSMDPTRASKLVFAVRPLPAAGPAADPHAAHAQAQPADPHAGHAHDPAPALVQAGMEGSFSVPGFPGYEFRVARFFGHLMIGETGPVNAGRDFDNPAALLDILQDGRPVGQQWAFARFPGHSRGGLPFTLEMQEAQPALASGFEVNTNPGAPLVWFGFGLSTLGLILSFLVQHRCVFLLARPAERGWTLWLAGRSDRERFAFAREFERLLDTVREEARRQRRAPRQVGAGSSNDSGSENSSGEVLAAPTV
jgi:cytochrome c biogenesis protein